MKDIMIAEYDYSLPEESIAQHPVEQRDHSQLLISQKGQISKDNFRNIKNHIPSGSLLVFNNTRVIRARLLFKKESGAAIEILCLEPISPSDYQLSFSSLKQVEWKCIVGNLKKWKSGELKLPFYISGKKYNLKALKLKPEGDAYVVLFSWDNETISFGEVIEAVGHIPLPPYINRTDEEEDSIRYQTVYSSVNGSVAAPTAGLHFTKVVLNELKDYGIKTTEVTLHVGAGTFQPVKSASIADHQMHCEHFIVNSETIKLLSENAGKIIPVGTTSVRTLETLYWLGVKLIHDQNVSTEGLTLGQWEAYDLDQSVTVINSMNALIKYMRMVGTDYIKAATSVIIVPGYKFRMTNGIITNFHQPRSTLLLLISAFTGKKWRDIYNFALENNFRFLSYGDSSLLLDQESGFTSF